MNFTTKRKSLGTLAIALAMATTLSLSAFAQSTATDPITKPVDSSSSSAAAPGEVVESNLSVAGEMTDSTAAMVLTEAQVGVRPTDESAAAVIDTRVNETTGATEITEDGGKTWTPYDGVAAICTPAEVGVRPSK